MAALMDHLLDTLEVQGLKLEGRPSSVVQDVPIVPPPFQDSGHRYHRSYLCPANNANMIALVSTANPKHPADSQGSLFQPDQSQYLAASIRLNST